MESRALEIIKSILELVKERDSLKDELQSTKRRLEDVVSARIKNNVTEIKNPCVVCGREAEEGMVCAECERRSGLR